MSDTQLVSLFLPGPAKPSQEVRYRLGVLTAFNPDTLANTVTIDGSTFTDLPILGTAEGASFSVGSTVVVLVLGNQTSSTVYAIDGRLVYPNTAAATDAVALYGGMQAWTPTLTNITKGSGGVVQADYARLNDLVFYRFKFTMGTGSAMGTGPRFSLPVSANGSLYASDDVMGLGNSLDAGIALYSGEAIYNGDGTVRVRVTLASGTYASPVDISATTPFTWGSGDVLSAQGWYFS